MFSREFSRICVNIYLNFSLENCSTLTCSLLLLWPFILLQCKGNYSSGGLAGTTFIKRLSWLSNALSQATIQCNAALFRRISKLDSLWRDSENSMKWCEVFPLLITVSLGLNTWGDRQRYTKLTNYAVPVLLHLVYFSVRQGWGAFLILCRSHAL